MEYGQKDICFIKFIFNSHDHILSSFVISDHLLSGGIESSKTILDTFIRLNRDENLTVVMVTHEKDFAKLADRDIELFDGKIIGDIMQRHSRTRKRHLA